MNNSRNGLLARFASSVGEVFRMSNESSATFFKSNTLSLLSMKWLVFSKQE